MKFAKRILLSKFYNKFLSLSREIILRIKLFISSRLYIKKILLIWIIINPVSLIIISLNCNQEFSNLETRAKYLSIPYYTKYINKINSNVTEGDQIEGIVVTTLRIPNEFVNKEFTLQIEANSNRSWNYYISKDDNRYPSRELRIEIIINHKIYKVLNFTELPSYLYPKNTIYNKLVLGNYQKKLTYSERLNQDSNRKDIKVQLITKHELFKDQKIFSDFYIDKDYQFTICIGNPEIVFYSIVCFFLITWILSLILVKNFEMFVKNK